MDPGLNDEADVGLVWVVLEHVNARLHRTLHRGYRNSLNIKAIHFRSVRFCLGHTDCVKVGVYEALVDHE